MRLVRFTAEQLTAVLDGKRSATIRRYSKGDYELKFGQRFYGMFADEASSSKTVLTATAATVFKPLNRLTNAEAQAAGFQDRWAAQRALKAENEGMVYNEQVAIIRFRPISDG